MAGEETNNEKYDRKVLEAYSKLVIFLVDELNAERDKCKKLSNNMAELSRTITVLRESLDCHNEFLGVIEAEEDYLKFKDKFITGGNV